MSVYLKAFVVEWRDKKRRLNLISRANKGKHTPILISIILPALNSDITLSKTIESIQNQSYPHWELLLIDDGSYDNTLAIAAMFALKDKRIRIFTNESNRGVSYSRNVGLSHANGDYITFHDADDVSHPERLEYQLINFLLNPELTVVTYQYVRVNSNIEPYTINNKTVMNHLSGMMIARKVFEVIGYFKPLRISEDTEYYERIIIVFGKNTKFRIDKVLYYALFDPRSLLFSNSNLTINGKIIEFSVVNNEFSILEECRKGHQLIANGLISPYQKFIKNEEVKNSGEEYILNKTGRIAVFSKGIKDKKNIQRLLGAAKLILKPEDAASIDYVVGWGRKPNTKEAIEYSTRNNLNYYSLEDGFLHSMNQGVLGAESFSLVKDSCGIYYDATRSSDLENIILNKSAGLTNPEMLLRAKSAIERISNANISKYNNGTLKYSDNNVDSQKVVLVIDQTAGDMSLKYGGVSDNSFKDMLQSALDDNPKARILIKTHPDVIAGKKKGSINIPVGHPRVTVISEFINPLILLKKVDLVYVVTSQMGFEALMLNKKVICFGAPFYAGWGLTTDKGDTNLEVWKRRNVKRSMEEVFAAAYISYSRYLHPDTNHICELEDILDYFELQYKMGLVLNKKIFCINFSNWKRDHIKTFLGSETEPVFVSTSHEAIEAGFDSNSQLVTWASKDQAEVEKLVDKFDVEVWNIEDGFIRSIGLGSDLTVPASLVLDKSGIYYDPSKPSDLEYLIQNKNFSAEELKRADNLRFLLLDNELSKYNLGKKLEKKSLLCEPEQKVILIPGQVEADASIKKGCADIKTNSDLIKAVRNNLPDAYLIYKPHPDVESGNREGNVEKDIIKQYCDLVLKDVSITDCMSVVDEVHTMSSLVGFEALLRNLKVVCYGIPFYSGWGLTTDRHTLSQRTRKVQLSELVAATLIDYPRYINWQTGAFTTPEVIVSQLKEQIEKQGGKQAVREIYAIRKLRKIKNFFVGVISLGGKNK